MFHEEMSRSAAIGLSLLSCGVHGHWKPCTAVSTRAKVDLPRRLSILMPGSRTRLKCKAHPGTPVKSKEHPKILFDSCRIFEIVCGVGFKRAGPEKRVVFARNPSDALWLYLNYGTFESAPPNKAFFVCVPAPFRSWREAKRAQGLRARAEDSGCPHSTGAALNLQQTRNSATPRTQRTADMCGPRCGIQSTTLQTSCPQHPPSPRPDLAQRARPRRGRRPAPRSKTMNPTRCHVSDEPSRAPTPRPMPHLLRPPRAA